MRTTSCFYRRQYLAFSLLIALVSLVALPARMAFAQVDSDDVWLNIPEVTIDATLEADGTLKVEEVRTFEGSFNGIYWYVPTGEYDGVTVNTTIEEVGILTDAGEFVSFENNESGKDGSYELKEWYDAIRVKAYSEQHNAKIRLVIRYTSTNVGRRYDDVAELYWQFVTRGWSSESENVTCRVHLPVPEGEPVIPGENVRAWGHGSLDAKVEFSGNDLVYTVPGVGESEFAEARITIPAGWLSGANSMGGKKLDAILEEEQRWADEANARRARARFVIYGGSALGLLIALGTILVSIIAKLRYRRSHKPLFDDTYFRDVPSNDHPAVLGALLHGEPNDECLTASLMRLSDMGAIKLDLLKIKEKGRFGREKTREEYRISNQRWLQRGEVGVDDIDWKTQNCFMDKYVNLIARRKAGKKVAVDLDSESSFYFSDLEKAAQSYPHQYADIHKSWTTKVQAACKERKFFEDPRPTGAAPVLLAVALSVLGAFGIIALWLFTEMDLLLAFGIFALLVIAAVAGFLTADSLGDFSEEAIEIKAKLEALRRWLKDFTRLEEAVPQDVILWNRLLVMAVVLGVAEEVIEQLKLVAPQMLESPQMRPVYGWYYGAPAHRPYASFSSQVSSAHRVSEAQIAESSSSSGSGSGGGFSSGGGGGFGGGGSHSGGGAF